MIMIYQQEPSLKLSCILFSQEIFPFSFPGKPLCRCLALPTVPLTVLDRACAMMRGGFPTCLKHTAISDAIAMGFT